MNEFIVISSGTDRDFGHANPHYEIFHDLWSAWSIRLKLFQSVRNWTWITEYIDQEYGLGNVFVIYKYLTEDGTVIGLTTINCR